MRLACNLNLLEKQQRLSHLHLYCGVQRPGLLCWRCRQCLRVAWKRARASGRGGSPSSSPEPPGRRTLPRAGPAGRSPIGHRRNLPGPAEPTQAWRGERRGGAAPGPRARWAPSKVSEPRRSAAPAARARSPPTPGEWVAKCPWSRFLQRNSGHPGHFPVNRSLVRRVSSAEALSCSDSLVEKFLLLWGGKELLFPEKG